MDSILHTYARVPPPLFYPCANSSLTELMAKYLLAKEFSFQL